jgi:hypothetical protein
MQNMESALCLPLSGYCLLATGLAPDDQASVEFWISLISSVLAVSIFSLVVFAYCIRFIARKRTHPCPWCTEFIPKAESTCPRCGKSVRAA